MRQLVPLFLALAACPPSEPVVEAPPPEVEAPAAEAAVVAEAPAAAGPRVFFVDLAEGAVVKSPLKLVFGLEGMEVRPAGTLDEKTGHHHLIVDGQAIPAGTAVPADATHIHFGKGQTEHEIELAPGEHTLTMQFADGNHVSYGPEMSTSIKVVVE